jgi:hypothetical protein
VEGWIDRCDFGGPSVGAQSTQIKICSHSVCQIERFLSLKLLFRGQFFSLHICCIVPSVCDATSYVNRIGELNWSETK